LITLDPNFLTIDPIDFEYKSYMVLGYKQKIINEFSSYQLYPYINDVSLHIITISNFLINKKVIDSTDQVITGIDIGNNSLIYKPKFEDVLMNDIETLAEYSLHHFRDMLKIGKDLFDEVEKSLQIHEMGLKSLDKGEGILLTCNGKVFNVYHFNICYVVQENGTNLVLTTELIDTQEKTKELNHKTMIKNIRKNYINDIYYVIFDEKYPFEETSFPVLKRKFLTYLSKSFSIVTNNTNFTLPI
jgi:cytochrome b involved in lipid metabolism